MLDELTPAQKRSIEDLVQGRVLPAEADLMVLLTALGLPYHLRVDKGEVSLSETVSLIGAQSVESNIAADIAYQHHWIIDSTNKRLMGLPPSDGIHVCTAEMQALGRGRRGRSWVSPFGKNIYLSWLSTIDLPMNKMAGLSLAVGIQVATFLRSLGCPKVGLKWPNDLMIDDSKLGGILIELEPVTPGRTRVCIGLGLNVLTAPDHQEVGRKATCLADYGDWDRTKLITGLIGELKVLVESFKPDQGPELQTRWADFDVYRGRMISVLEDGQVVEGVNEGIDPNGQLVLNCNQIRRTFNAGEVSMRVSEAKER